jgi:hypothetical protein
MVTFATNFNKKNVNAKTVEILLNYIQEGLNKTLKKSVSQIRGASKKEIVTVILI